MTFNELLTRVDSELLQQLLGPSVVRVLVALDQDLVRPQSLRDTLLELHPPEELLVSKRTRQLLLELLRRDEAVALCEHLGLSAGVNPYPPLLALEVNQGTTSAVLLLSFFGLHEPPPPPAPEPSLAACAGGYELFPHQRTAVRAASQLATAHPYRLVIHMPTGSGKTRTAMSLIADHLRQHEPTLALWLAAGEELCDQAADEFANAWSKLGNRSVPVHRWWGKHPIPADVPPEGFAIAGLAKLYARGMKDLPWWARLGDRTSLIVFDEAHQAIAPTYRQVVEALLARNSDLRLIGLTATPGRTWNDVAADEELSNFFAKRKVMLAIPGYSNPVEYLIDEGYLARPLFRTIDHQGPELSESERMALGVRLEISDSILQRLADDHLRNLAIAQEVRDLARRHKRILVFTATVAHAEMLAIVLKALGIAARAVTAATPTQRRSAAISWYRQPSEDVRVLVNYGVLTTGFDAPRTSAALIARPTKSLVLFSQMVGRATRGVRAGGNKEAEIVTVVDTGLPGFRTLAEAFTNWEDVWRH